MKLNRFTINLVAFLALLGVGATAAQADENLAQAPIKGDGGTIRLMVNMAGTQSFPPFVIQKSGLDKKYGFVLQTIPSATTQTTTTGFQSGGAELGIMGWNDLSRIKNGGVNVVGVAPFLGWANTIVVAADSPLHTLGDLKGKKVGVYSRTGLDWVVMRSLASKQYKLDLEKDIVIQEGAVSLLRGLMEQNALDATQMFNDLTAPMVVGGKFRVMASIKSLVDQLGVPDTPFLLYTADAGYASAHPNNIKAFVAAYREAIMILKTDDGPWTDRATELNMTDPAIVAALRTQSRPMLMSSFTPSTEANIRKLWDVLVATAGAETLGGAKLADGFMTLDYQ
jgi:NitT/TauT family transport system substrate-binding protein